jgi:G3E family GTPase
MKLFLISGFLGSGKTTAIKEACTLLLKNNTKVAVVTNDQGADLVDILYLRSFGIPAEEVPNSCFCCNFPQLTEHIAALTQSSLISCMRDSASGCLETSGWYLRANLRKAFLISSAVASRGTPSVW